MSAPPETFTMLYAMPEASDRTSCTKFIFPKMQPIIKDSTVSIEHQEFQELLPWESLIGMTMGRV